MINATKIWQNGWRRQEHGRDYDDDVMRCGLTTMPSLSSQERSRVLIINITAHKLLTITNSAATQTGWTASTNQQHSNCALLLICQQTWQFCSHSSILTSKMSAGVRTNTDAWKLLSRYYEQHTRQHAGNNTVQRHRPLFVYQPWPALTSPC